MKRLAVLALSLAPSAVFAGDLIVSDAWVPLAPPKAMAHAGYFTLTNAGEATRSLIGISAEGYGAAHLHQSTEADGLATMSMLHQIDIAPGQSIAFKQGGLHVMLMRPEAAPEEGTTVAFMLEFANGETLPVAAKVMKRVYDAHAHGS